VQHPALTVVAMVMAAMQLVLVLAAAEEDITKEQAVQVETDITARLL
jgi:hypothetical protein